ncbi:YggS family pyridoxal phosphate-dependent enzyme [Ruminococcus sp. Marseille-P6503]|uniref:YggS family pyridoxal phosphate-dependent enzyme n=1 Tax=Ruminococcus sp. Marseille-P6503 TaxID=2364796 RepID=UPI000F53E05A|nr:YggS family pyridoxal phosphate-dependent enzyme [Ruminococcus sp. Marseille-P6503]
MCQKSVNPPEFQYILENYRQICYNVGNAAAKYGSGSVKIMAVTKTVPPEKVNYAVSLGIDLLGENRVQEYLSKKDSYDKSARVHMIGHLQTNKVKYVINNVDMIQSVDSVKLANEINRLAEKNKKTMDILIEVNIGGEESKSGVPADRVYSLIEEISAMKSISVKGLMAVPPIGSGDEAFDKMNLLFQGVKEKRFPGVSMDILSMGMSGDYETAIKHGSNLVRIGTKLFGARKYLEV